MTVLIPAHGHLELVKFAIGCVQNQTHADWELFVVCDGVHPETLDVARRAAAEDPRIRVLDFPKGMRHGEAYRHTALGQATGEAVCYLSDDDLWLEDHLSVMAELLHEHDFVHTRNLLARGDRVVARPESISESATRERMLAEQWNPHLGVTNAGHRLDFYRRLPVGWSPAPWDITTDLHMWRKFLAAPGARLKGSAEVTTLHLSQRDRKGWLPQRHYNELGAWYRLTLDRDFVGQLRRALAGKEGVTELNVVARGIWPEKAANRGAHGVGGASTPGGAQGNPDADPSAQPAGESRPTR